MNTWKKVFLGNMLVHEYKGSFLYEGIVPDDESFSP